MKPFILLSLLFSTFALAGNEVGGGGYIITCASTPSPWEHPIRSSRLLDFYENTTYHIDYSETEVPSWLHVSGIIDRMRKFDPQRAEAYHLDFLNFSANFTLRFLDQNWPNDLGATINIPTNCHLRRGIYRTHDEDGYHYSVDDVAWGSLNKFHQAGLVMHEIVYGHATEDNHQLNSHNARQFTSYLFSNEFQNATQVNYDKVVNILGLNSH